MDHVWLNIVKRLGKKPKLFVFRGSLVVCLCGRGDLITWPYSIRTATLSHTDLLIPSALRGWITVCKSTFPCSTEWSHCYDPGPPFDPATSWGVHTHLSNPVGPQHRPIHYSAEPLEFIRNTHTHTPAETSTSGADWRKVTETRSADALLFSRAVFYIPLCRRCSFITTREWRNHTHLGFEDSGSRSFSTTLIVSVLGRLFGRNTSVLGCRCVCLQAVWVQM